MPRTLSLFAAVTVAIAIAGMNPAAVAQTRQIPSSAAQVQLSYAPIVKRVAPTVVTIRTAKVGVVRNPLFDDPFFRRFFGPQFGTPREEIQRSLGSGVIVDPSGLIVTNNHVIEGANEIKVSLSDRREFEAKVVLKDSRTDLAVLRLKSGKERFPAIQLGNSDDLQVGDLVLAVGDPFGVGQTVTQGIISALARTQIGKSDYQFYIQTDAAINPGNSGGPLVNMSGKLVGLNSAIYSRSGGFMGIGFAIPVNMVKVVLAAAERGSKTVKLPWFGAKLQEVTPEIADSLGLKRPIGVLVASVAHDSPAAEAGLRSGDLIVSIDGQAVDEPNGFDYRFATRPLGSTAHLDVIRSEHEIRLDVPVRPAPSVPRDELVIRSRSPFMGAKVENISPAMADQLKINAPNGGVVVVGVQDGSPADRYGFHRGDLIESVNGEKITKTRELERVAETDSRVWRVIILRHGQRISAVFRG